MGILDRLAGQFTGQGGLPKGSRIAVIDCETTGLNAKSDRILELAIVELDNDGNTLSRWLHRFNPDGPVGATHIHGISEADVAGAPRFAEDAEEIVSLLRGRAIVAHNTRFDLAFLRSELKFAGWAMPFVDAFCTLRESQHFLPALDRRRLLDCCSAVGVELRGAHSAAGDAMATADLFMAYVGQQTKPPFTAAHRDIVGQGMRAEWPTKPTAKPRPLPLRTKSPAKSSDGQVRVKLLENASRLSLSDVLGPESPAGSVEYVELLLETVADGEITAAEREQLAALGETLELDESAVEACARALLNALAQSAWADGFIELKERQQVGQVAELLGLREVDAKAALALAERLRDASIGAESRPLPDDWDLGEPLRVGDRFAYTGGDPRLRTRLEEKAVSCGLRLSASVTKKTAVLVTDGDFSSRKAEAAAEIGTRVVRPDVFERILDFVQPAA